MNNIYSIAKSYSNLFETDESKTKELIKKSGISGLFLYTEEIITNEKHKQKLDAFKSIVNTYQKILSENKTIHSSSDARDYLMARLL